MNEIPAHKTTAIGKLRRAVNTGLNVEITSHEALALITALTAAPASAEPVAWYFEWKPSTNSNPWQADVSLKDPRINPVRDIRNVRPLYAGAACDADGECGQ